MRFMRPPTFVDDADIKPPSLNNHSISIIALSSIPISTITISTLPPRYFHHLRFNQRKCVSSSSPQLSLLLSRLRRRSAAHLGAQMVPETAVVPGAKEPLFASVAILMSTKMFLLYARTLATADAQATKTDVALAYVLFAFTG